MSRLLILTFFLVSSAWGSPSAKQVAKAPLKAFKTSTVRLSSTYIQSYPSSEIMLRIEPKTLKDGKKLVQAQCKKNILDCAIFQDSQNSSLLNISVRGRSSNIKNLLLWAKKNSTKYTETQHKKK